MTYTGEGAMGTRVIRLRAALCALFAALLALPSSPWAAIDLLGRTTATFRWSHADGNVTGYEVYVACGQGEVPVHFEPYPTLTIEAEPPSVDISAGFGTHCKIRVRAEGAYGRVSSQSVDSDVIHFVEPAPAENDFDGDGISDIIVQAQDNGRALLLSGSDVHTGDEFLYLRTTINTSDDLNWEIVDTGDFNGDGVPEFLWFAVRDHRRFGVTTYSYIVGTDIDNTTLVLTGATDSEEIIAVADFNGDGADDILHRTNDLYGTVYVTFMGPDGVIRKSRYQGALREQFDFVAAGDFDGDGNDDVMWRRRETGQVVIWLMTRPGRAKFVNSGVLPGPHWYGEAAGNFNNSIEDDVLWRNIETGETLVWYMDEFDQPIEHELGNLKFDNWSLLAAGDLNADGRTDITWFDADTNLLEVWRMDENLENGFRIE